jgi:hypothetical protein
LRQPCLPAYTTSEHRQRFCAIWDLMGGATPGMNGRGNTPPLDTEIY